jgi:branched-chain amino acid transport system permease protein
VCLVTTSKRREPRPSEPHESGGSLRTPMEEFVQQTINGLSVGSVFALLGLGVTMVWGVLGVLNFAHAQILTWGAFATWFALDADVPVLPAIAFGIVVAIAMSLALNATVVAALRRRQAPEFAFVVATIGVALILEEVLREITDAETRPFPREGFPTEALEIGAITIPGLQVVVLVVSVAVMTALAYWLNRTKSGRAVRTVAYSRETAELMGINSKRVYMLAFAISGGLAAIAGIFVAVDSANISFSTGDPLLLSAFAVMILGGMGSPKGAMVGGLLLGIAQVYATVYVSSVFRQAVAMLIILAVLLLRPQGLFGEPQAARV